MAVVRKGLVPEVEEAGARALARGGRFGGEELEGAEEGG